MVVFWYVGKGLLYSLHNQSSFAVILDYMLQQNILLHV